MPASKTSVICGNAPVDYGGATAVLSFETGKPCSMTSRHVTVCHVQPHVMASASQNDDQANVAFYHAQHARVKLVLKVALAKPHAALGGTCGSVLWVLLLLPRSADSCACMRANTCLGLSHTSIRATYALRVLHTMHRLVAATRLWRYPSCSRQDAV